MSSTYIRRWTVWRAHTYTSALDTPYIHLSFPYVGTQYAQHIHTPLTSPYTIDTPQLLSLDILSSTAPKSMYVSTKRMYTCKYVSHAVRMHIRVACGACVYMCPLLRKRWAVGDSLLRCWRRAALGSSRKPNLHRPNPTYLVV